MNAYSYVPEQSVAVPGEPPDNKTVVRAAGASTSSRSTRDGYVMDPKAMMNALQSAEDSGGGLLAIVYCILWPALIVVDVMAMMKALKGERWRIPVVTVVAEKFLK